MKIYIVTKGEYSDYHIIAATLSKQRAENIAKIYSDNWDEAEVEEYEEMSGGELAKMMAKLEERFVFHINNDGTIGEVCAIYEKKDAPHMNVMTHRIDFSIAAKDKEQAIKIARDLRFKYYAEKYGL